MSTRTPIASIVSSSNASSVTFTGIPQFYTDLILNISVKHSSTVENHRLRFNGDAAASYADLRIFGNGTNPYTDSRENGTSILLGEMSTSQYGADKWFIPQYTNTSMHKRITGFGGNIGGNAQAGTGEYRSYNAITSITILAGSGNFVDGSTFNLYGIASGSTKASGGSVTTDGTYFYHTFVSSGIFTAHQALTTDYLVVAGGGGGGFDAGGAGGAGGLRSTVTASGGTPGTVESALTLLPNTSHTVTVGSGGAGATSSAGGAGTDSVFSTITSTGGGKGGGRNTDNATSGGSGGGGAGDNTSTTRPGKSGTNNEGYAGGNGYASASDIAGGGGGGAGGAGSAGNSNGNGGAGGNGVSVSISGSSVTYAGGGGGGQGVSAGVGGSGGSGGGGAGGGSSNSNLGQAGSVNLGSGGGGGSRVSPATGGNGGSGVVIVRYAV